jgi:hypothetical protein
MKKVVILFAAFCLIFVSCNKDDIIDPNKENQTIKKETVSGLVQKGPFINGTSIIIAELDSNLTQTGRTFSTQINSNTGSFEIKGVELSSPYVEIKADGFYYNEVEGDVSSERLTLQAVATLEDQNTLNVNVLTTLEKPRLEYLFDQGKSFIEAKKQAQQEVLALFELSKPDMLNSETLNIAGEGDDNAILFAVSVIIQGNRQVSGVAELLANISFDIMEDGRLDDPATGSQLINGVKRMEMSKVRNNVKNRYNELGMNIEVPDFESKVAHFIESTGHEYTLSIQYPNSGKYGKNLLALEDGETIGANLDFSLHAIVPADCKLRVVYKKTGQMEYSNLIRYSMSGEITGWNVPYSTNTDRIEWIAIDDYRNVDTKMFFVGIGSGVFEIYENEDVSPSRIINFEWDFVNESEIVFPQTGQYGENILAMDDNTVLDRTKTYSVAADFPDLILFEYFVDLSRTSQSGSMSYSSVTGWDDHSYLSTGNGFFLGLRESNKQTDAMVNFDGEGAFTLQLLIYPYVVVSEKNFTWE